MRTSHYPQFLGIQMEFSSSLLSQTPHILYMLYYVMYLHTVRWAYAENEINHLYRIVNLYCIRMYIFVTLFLIAVL